jgi:hypothetical protein
VHPVGGHIGRLVGTVFEGKFMLPWSFLEEGAAQKIALLASQDADAAGIISRSWLREKLGSFRKNDPRLMRPIEPRFMATEAAALTPDLTKRSQSFSRQIVPRTPAYQSTIATTRMVG